MLRVKTTHKSKDLWYPRPRWNLQLLKSCWKFYHSDTISFTLLPLSRGLKCSVFTTGCMGTQLFRSMRSPIEGTVEELCYFLFFSSSPGRSCAGLSRASKLCNKSKRKDSDYWGSYLAWLIASSPTTYAHGRERASAHARTHTHAGYSWGDCHCSRNQKPIQMEGPADSAYTWCTVYWEIGR